MKSFKKKIFLKFVVLLAFIIFSAMFSSSHAEENEPISGINKFYKEEGLRIAKYHDNVRREGDTLYLKLKSGAEKSYRNLTGCDGIEPCMYIDFQEYLSDIDLYILNVHLYEGGHYLVISGKFEKEYQMHAYPEISPDRQHMVAVSQDETGYGENSIRLWRIEESELIEEFYFNVEDLGYYNLNSFSRWQDNRTIIVDRFFNSDNIVLCSKPGHVEAQFALRKAGDSWRLDKNILEGTANCTP